VSPSSFLKIKTLTVIVACVLALFAGIAVFSTYYVGRQMSAVEDNWHEFRQGPIRKAAILSDLRNALGYGGMIHNFKNFILRKDRAYVLRTSLDILRITALLTAYHDIGLNGRERAALNVLDSRLTKYEEAIAIAEKMAMEGRTSREIDAAVRINDELAISAMLALVDELAKAHAVESKRIQRTETQANRTSKQIMFVSLGLAVLSIGFTVWFMYRRVLGPLRVLGHSMQEISRKKTSDPVPGTERDDEIGDMARTVEVFRGVVMERKNIESSLAESRELAESSNQAKNEFLAHMSHELRTPLNGIIGLSEMIRENTFGPLGNEKYAEYIDDIHKSGKHLLALVQTILDVSEIDSGSVTLSEDDTDMGKIINKCIRELTPDAKNKGISISDRTAEADLPVRVDSSRIMRVFNNILGNAIKFTPDKGAITIDSLFEEDGALAISVTDTGIGMAHEAIETALSPFGQIDRGSFAKHEGAGLGLYLSRLVVEMHDGEMRINSAQNRGTRVTVVLPASRVLEGA
jgi:signal transduction histidine kinase